MTPLRIRDTHGRYRGPITAPGIYDVPADLYHGEPCAEPSVSASDLHLLLTECPAVAWHRSAMNPARPAFDTRAYRQGREAHAMLLEPERIDDLFAPISPGRNMRGDAGKAWRGKQERAGKWIVSAERFHELVEMRRAVMTHDFAGMAFTAGRPERTLVWRDAETGLLLRCRPDWLPDALAHIPDYKTAASARPDRFARDAFTFGYHMRAAHYLDGIAAVTGTRPKSYFFVVQEKAPPWLVTVMTLDRDALEWGAIQNRKALRSWADCLAAGRWPGYADEVVEIGLPGWAEHELQRRDAAGDFTVSQGSGIGDRMSDEDTPGGQSILAAG